jgi:hypothetical protein
MGDKKQSVWKFISIWSCWGDNFKKGGNAWWFVLPSVSSWIISNGNTMVCILSLTAVGEIRNFPSMLSVYQHSTSYIFMLHFRIINWLFIPKIYKECFTYIVLFYCRWLVLCTNTLSVPCCSEYSIIYIVQWFSGRIQGAHPARAPLIWKKSFEIDHEILKFEKHVWNWPWILGLPLILVILSTWIIRGIIWCIYYMATMTPWIPALRWIQRLHKLILTVNKYPYS